MRIAITDANIFIDLIYVDFHSHLFALDFEVHTSLEVFDELDESQQNTLQNFILKEKLTLHDCTEIAPIESVKSIRTLSDSDKTVLYLAKYLEAFVLSGDGVIRRIAGIQKIELHGVFWLLDKFLNGKLITKKEACHQLKKLLEFNKRLPQQECENRIREWCR